MFGRKHCYRLYSEHLNEAVRWVCAVQKVIDSKAPVQTPTQLLMRDVEVGPRHRGGGHGGDTAGARPGGPSAAAAVAFQEHCGSPEVLEQIYRCNPILRYTSSPLYAPLLPFPYGSLDQSGERVGGRGTLGCQTVLVQGTLGCQTVPVQRGGPGAEQEWQELGWV